MVASGFVIFLVCRKRQLGTKINTFVVSLTVADFGVGMLAVPSRFSCGHPNESTPPLKEGLFVIVVRVFIIYTSGTNLVSLVLERYVAMVKPLKYLVDFNEAPSSHLNGSNISGNSHRRTGKILLGGLNIICPNKNFWSQMHKMILSSRQVFFAIS